MRQFQRLEFDSYLGQIPVSRVHTPGLTNIFSRSLPLINLRGLLSITFENGGLFRGYSAQAFTVLCACHGRQHQMRSSTSGKSIHSNSTNSLWWFADAKLAPSQGCWANLHGWTLLDWSGFTNDIPWIVPTLSGLFTGFGLCAIFLQLLNYIINVYFLFAAPVISGNTFLRSLFGTIFPLFARYIHVRWNWNQLREDLDWSNFCCFGTSALHLLIYERKIWTRSTVAPAPDIDPEKTRDEESSGDGQTNENTA